MEWVAGYKMFNGRVKTEEAAKTYSNIIPDFFPIVIDIKSQKKRSTVTGL
jgi:hypothetical protein